MGKKSRNKGAGYERKIAKLLSEWSGAELRRTPLSGGWARSNPHVSGDVVSITRTEDWPLHVECKNNEAWNWEAIIKGRSGSIDSWWKQTIDTCPQGRFPLLVFSKAYRTDWVMLKPVFPLELFSSYVRYNGRVIVRLEELLSCFSYEQFMEMIADAVPETPVR